MVRRARGRFVCDCVLNHILWYPKRGAGVGSCVFDHSYQRTHSLTQCSPFPGEPSQVRDLFVCSSHAHTHILTQCSLSSGNSERGARGRLISYSHTHSPFPGEPSQVRDFSVCSSHAHTHTHTLVPQEGCRGYTHILTQCSLSPGNSERGARGRLVCIQSHTHSL